MNKIYKKILFIIIFIFLVTLPCAAILAQEGKALEGLKNTGFEAGYLPDDSTAKPPSELSKALIQYTNDILTLFGTFYLILMIYAGYIWMNSRGNEEEVNKAKKIIIWATAGLAVIILGRVIVEFAIIALGSASGIPQT